MELPELKTATATQTSGDSGKSQWEINNNERENIYVLPSEWNEKQVMEAIHFGRKFEEVAFNKGIQFQKKLVPARIKDLEAIVRQLTYDKEALMKENERIGTALDKIVTSKK